MKNTEKEKMFRGERYNAHTREMYEIRTKVKRTLHKLNVTEYYTDKFQDVINELCPNSAKNLHLEPPFYCDYGDHIYAEENVFINFGAVILDGAKVTIGAKLPSVPE